VTKRVTGCSNNEFQSTKVVSVDALDIASFCVWPGQLIFMFCVFSMGFPGLKRFLNRLTPTRIWVSGSLMTIYFAKPEVTLCHVQTIIRWMAPIRRSYANAVNCIKKWTVANASERSCDNLNLVWRFDSL
jgi:hypothetical protein